MLSKNQMKLLRALGQKKYRKSQGQFLVQGEKNVEELLNSELKIVSVFATSRFINKYQEQLKVYAQIVFETDETTLSKVSTLAVNNSVIAVVEIPKVATLQKSGCVIALDGVSDPGNLGTIIRVADWYGIPQVIVSQHCADPYNPKTISATMGSFSRIEVIAADLVELFNHDPRPKYGAFLEGDNIHKLSLPKDAIIVMGSESHGISPAVATHITHRVTIPSFGAAESLNVAMATGIILDNFKR